MMKKVVVIGAGLGGLSAAIRLQKAGYQVTILEQNGKTGGKANEISEGGFRFDTGPSLLTMPFVIEQLFQEAGLDAKNYLEFIQPEVLCRYFYPSGKVIDAFSDLIKFIDELSGKFDLKKEVVESYFDYSKKIYDLTAELFLFNSFREWSTFFNKKAALTLLNLPKIDSFRTMHEANKSFFGDPEALQLFDRYATYNGSNPYLAPATLNIIQHVEYGIGGYTLKGGIYSLSKALTEVALKSGVKIATNRQVDEIVLAKNDVQGVCCRGKVIDDPNRVVGVRCGEELFETDIVVSNSDVTNTYKKLLNDSQVRPAKKYYKREPSSSALVFYWGVKGNFPELKMHNILFSDDYKKEFDEIFISGKAPEDPTVYIYISSKVNEDDAPEGFENWFVMINMPPATSNDYYSIDSIKKSIISKIKNMLHIDLNENIVFERVLTPEMIEEKTSSVYGSLYGISSNNKYAAFLRQDNRSREYAGLYFCGGSAHPGGGIPLVILSGKIVSELVAKYETREMVIG